MPAVAKAMVSDLSALEPAHAALFPGKRREVRRSLKPWYRGDREVQGRLPGHAGRDDRAGRRLHARGRRDEERDAFALQADIMNGVDPAPQDMTLQNSLFTGHKVKVFLYNQQVTDSMTQSFLELCQEERDTGGRRVRDDADARLRLPVLDAGRGPGPGKGRGRQGLDGELVTTDGCAPAQVGRSSRSRVCRAAVRAHDPRSGQLPDRARRVHGPDRVQRRRQDDDIQGDPRAAGGDRRARALCGLVHARGAAGRRSATCRRASCLTRTFRCARGIWWLSGSTRTGSASRCPRGAGGRSSRRCWRPLTPSASPIRVSASSPAASSSAILIAHALIARPRLLLLDEPLANLDLRSAHEVVALLARIATRAGDSGADLRARDQPAAARDGPRRLPRGRARGQRHHRGGRPRRRPQRARTATTSTSWTFTVAC